MIGDSNDETNFSHKFLLSDTQVLRLCQAFANGSSANIKLSKTQLSNMVQSRDVLPFPLIFTAYKIGEEVVKRKAITLAKYAAKQFVNKGNRQA